MVPPQFCHTNKPVTTTTSVLMFSLQPSTSRAILSPKEKTSMSYRARSVDSGIGDADSSHAFFLGLDSVLNSPTSPSHSER